MKKLLSLPPNPAHCFHQVRNVSADEWFCTSDPVGNRLGSGGGTAWLLEQCRRSEAPALSAGEWLAKEKRILIHAGGQSRRLPAYAPSGKILTPIPVFRWVRGQQLKQDLLSLQLPLYEAIASKAPGSLHTLVASGDVYIRCNEPLQEIPVADVVCYGLWADAALATHHGVFLAARETPGALDFMLQKPSTEALGRLAGTHLFLMDTGVWLLSDKAVQLLMERSQGGETGMKRYDLYGEFGLSLGAHPQIKDAALNSLTTAILPLPDGEFYHYGTGRELLSSTLAVQNLIRDQRAIMQRKVKPHPAMFVQNAEVHIPLAATNSELWIENSYIGSGWQLNYRHILTGIPKNDWQWELPAGICVDVVPVGDSEWAARPYGFDDTFQGALPCADTLYMGRPFGEWQAERGITLKYDGDIQEAPLFPVCATADELGAALRWMVAEPQDSRGKALWESARKMSATDLSDRANLLRLTAQRREFRMKNLPDLAANHEKSIFYQLDLSDAAAEFAAGDLPLPAPLSGAPLMKQVHDSMFRARTLQLKGKPFRQEERQAFALLREGLIAAMPDREQSPRLNIYRDQIVWGRSPVRIDLAGGWTDTPPYCLYAGGNVVNVAIELNGQPPLQAYIKPSDAYTIRLRSIDIGAVETVRTWEDLRNYKVGSPFSIPKAALSLAGFVPEFSADRYASLEEQLKAFGAGIEITLLSAVPAGSGLGTSSILAATVLGALSDFCGLGWDKNEIGNRTLILEQLLTTGGGWQDPFGGLLHGLKLLQTGEGFNQSPLTRWLPDYLFTDLQYRPCHLLYYTGITRTAKTILTGIVQSMFLNCGKRLRLLSEMKAHALYMYDAIQCGNFRLYGQAVATTWEQNKALDAGANPPAVEALIAVIKDYALGYKLPGAGGGGYLYIVAKDPEAAIRLRKILAENVQYPNARTVEMSLSRKGMQVSRS
ncbi:MAG: bifunctional fucokinase/L-fucose-1-P-guanylyltransferase [Bacteroidales bacterium]